LQFKVIAQYDLEEKQRGIHTHYGKKFPTTDSSTSAAPERSKQGSSLNGIDCSDGTARTHDVLEVDGKYYGFSGCHRFEACQRLGKEQS